MCDSSLTEDDIPGASLLDRKPSELKNEELKFWLRCRGDPAKGLKTKAELVERWVGVLFTMLSVCLYIFNVPMGPSDCDVSTCFFSPNYMYFHFQGWRVHKVWKGQKYHWSWSKLTLYEKETTAPWHFIKQRSSEYWFGCQFWSSVASACQLPWEWMGLLTVEGAEVYQAWHGQTCR